MAKEEAESDLNERVERPRKASQGAGTEPKSEVQGSQGSSSSRSSSSVRNARSLGDELKSPGWLTICNGGVGKEGRWRACFTCVLVKIVVLGGSSAS